MTGPICVRCARPLADGAFACDRCAAQAAQKLAEIAEVAPAARDVANGLSRRSQGGASGKPGSRLPLDLTAMAKLDGVQGVLTTWARHVAEERGQAIGGNMVDPIIPLAFWLAEQLKWFRHRPEADEFLTDVEACLRIVRSIVREPVDKKFFGICGSEIGWDDDGQEFQRDEPCKGQVYGLPDAEGATCRACKARWETAPRAKELGDKVREYAFSAKWIHEAYPQINLKTLRSWANRGQLKTYWRTAAELTVEWVEPVVDPKLTGAELAQREAEVAAEVKARGPRLHYVGDVLDLAASDAARREGDRATRARRAAARAAESETAA